MLGRKRYCPKFTQERIDLINKGQMDGYSGSDLALVCKEAAMRPLRSLMDDLEAGRIEDDKELSLRPVTNEDVHEALKCTRPSAKASKGKYEAWEKEFGST